MKMSGLFFSRLNNKVHQKPEIKSKNYCFFHDLIVSSIPLSGHYNPDIEEMQTPDEDNIHFTTTRTSFYLCKRFNDSQNFEKMPTLFMKRLSYRKSNKKDQWGRIVYNDSESKNYDQVTTQFQCLSLLKGSHRALQLIQVLHENTRSKEDMKFFYQFIRLADRRSAGIKNICFIFEKMNEGSLRERLQKIKAKKQKPFTQQEIIQYTCQIAEGLLELKNKGIIHRDLRPDNILLHNGQIKFSDFDSAFIRGYSDFRNIKNGVDMMDTTPLQIMLLIAQSEDKLQSLTSQQLYELQIKADIYFLGVNIYCMTFSQPFQSFNSGRILNNLINIKKRSGFCPKLLDLMARCLQKNSHVRIDLDETINILVQIEKQTYLKDSNYTHIHLGVQPLNLSSFSSNQKESTILIQSIIKHSSSVKYNRQQMDDYFKQAIKKATVQRQTSRYELMMRNIMDDVDIENVWNQSKKQIIVKNEAACLRDKIQSFLQRMQIKAYYYQFAYRILNEVNLDCVKSITHRQNIRTHLDLFSSELSVILTFIYDMLMRCSFTADPNYDSTNLSYQNRRVFETIKILYSRREFFAGRKRLMHEGNFNIELLQERLEEFRILDDGERHEEEVEQIEQGIKLLIICKQTVQFLQEEIIKFKQIEYDSNEKKYMFQYEYNYLKKTLQKMQNIIREQTKQTIISLILAYEQIKLQPWGHRSNLKNAIFMLMILEAQDTEKIHKNDMVIIKQQLSSMINLGLGWKSEELQAFFNNYTEMHPDKVRKGLHELKSHAVLADDQQDIFMEDSSGSLHDCIHNVMENKNVEQKKEKVNVVLIGEKDKKKQQQMQSVLIQVDKKVKESIVEEQIKTIKIQMHEKTEVLTVQQPMQTTVNKMGKNVEKQMVGQQIKTNVVQVQNKIQKCVIEQLITTDIFSVQNKVKRQSIENAVRNTVSQVEEKVQKTVVDTPIKQKKSVKIESPHKIQAFDFQTENDNQLVEDEKYKSFYRKGLRFLTSTTKQ